MLAKTARLLKTQMRATLAHARFTEYMTGKTVSVERHCAVFQLVLGQCPIGHPVHAAARSRCNQSQLLSRQLAYQVHKYCNIEDASESHSSAHRNLNPRSYE
ncbi:uncharacterized protein F5147DRAFT_620836 [Suillus discolor]|uniref:Uncharacterized protein n=1 Tax=Suillus discolor TaxID=1912936 RepID=A0A9P7ET24_9AGAM|nr:uncharacterized protein F5147DRAFT_620836 [Suillus discolor]KAG2088654.1 hypothetical protein F5147DRAFT_620836 [Suillus discolor]